MPEKEAAGKGNNAKKAKARSAALAAVKARQEAERKSAEENKASEEAERKRIEEEERALREEQERKEAKTKRRHDKIDKQKAEGTYLTKTQKKTQKLKAEKDEQVRKQLGFVMEADNDEDGEGAADTKPAPKRQPLGTKKKKQVQQQKEPEDEGPFEEPAKTEETKHEKNKVPPDDWEAEAEEGEVKKEEEAEDSDSSSSSSDSSDFQEYRAPIVCIMGHVDAGKTKLLDKIRRTNVQEGEASGITQQIGATFFPDTALKEQTNKVDADFDMVLPGLLMIDTPGHESFNNMRKRGSSLCDIAILVIDIMHGLKPQTVESLNMLKERKVPVLIALNKVDVLYSWKSEEYTSIRSALARQEDSVRQEFQWHLNDVKLQLNKQGINCALYWENEDFRNNFSIVPTSATTGEGVPDLLYWLLHLSQTCMPSNLEVTIDLQCTVIEVKNVEGLGTTIDVVIVNGTLRKGDTIVIAGKGGPIVTQIRALLTPVPMKEMRVKGEYVHNAKVDASMAVKISAAGLEDAVAGTELRVLGPNDDLEELKKEVQKDVEDVVKKQPAGVYVKASTLGSLKALVTELEKDEIPVFDYDIGEQVHKKDVRKAATMISKGHPEYAVILAFHEAASTEQAKKDGVRIMTSNTIYHLKKLITEYMQEFKSKQQSERRSEAVFPVELEIVKVFHKTDPLIMGCKVVAGQLKIGTPICARVEKDFVDIGRVASFEKEKGKPLPIARAGDIVSIKFEQTNEQNHIHYGRHFNHEHKLYSKISRRSIDTLKDFFKNEMKDPDWQVIVDLKLLFRIR